MILRLAVEQARSQWRVALWTASLLTIGLALATFALVTGATQAAHERHTADVNAWAHSQQANLHSWTNGNLDAHFADSRNQEVSPAELDFLVAEAVTHPDVTVSTEFLAALGDSGEYAQISAIATPVRWEAYLLEGRAPQKGEVILDRRTTENLGLEIGDRVTLVSDSAVGAPTRSMIVTLVGVTKTSVGTQYWTYLPNGFLSWDDLDEANTTLRYNRRIGNDGAETIVVPITFGWEGDVPALAPYAIPTESHGAVVDLATRMFQYISFSSVVAMLTSGFLIAGLIIAAFAIGRAQGEARAQWVATARVLGGTRGAVVRATLLEMVFIAVPSIILGTTLGYLGVIADLARIRSADSTSLIPESPSLPGLVALAIAILGVVLATIVSAVPAFWAARVSPVSALKPVAPVSEAQVSRPVRVRGLMVALALAVVGATVGYAAHDPDASEPTWAILVNSLSYIIIVVVGFAMLIEGLRQLVPVIGRRLSHSRRPWLVAAGDELVTHARLTTFASFSMVLIVGWCAVGTTVSAQSVVAYTNDYDYRGWGEPLLPGLVEWNQWTFLNDGGAKYIALAIGIATLVAVAITASARSAFTADSATRSALGLSRTHARLAAMLRQWVPMAMGIGVGALLGWGGTLTVRTIGAVVSPETLVYSLHWNLTVAGYSLYGTAQAAVLALAVTLLGAVLFAAGTGRNTPVEALRQGRPTRPRRVRVAR